MQVVYTLAQASNLDWLTRESPLKDSFVSQSRFDAYAPYLNDYLPGSFNAICTCDCVYIIRIKTVQFQHFWMLP